MALTPLLLSRMEASTTSNEPWRALLCTAGPWPGSSEETAAAPAAASPPFEPPPPPPPQRSCVVCDDLALFGSEDDPPAEPALPWTLRCARHTGHCANCHQPGVRDPTFDNCPTCAEKKNICVVCVSVHCAYGEMDVVLLADYPSRRCHQHKGWCAACLQYSVETDTDECCAKCKRENLVPAYTRTSVDLGKLEREGYFCRHFFRSDSCYQCYCACYWCTNRYGYAGQPMRLPPPPPPEPPLASLEDLLRAVKALRGTTPELCWMPMPSSPSAGK